MLEFLPEDWRQATLIGRIDFGEGPTPVAVRAGNLFDLSNVASTVAELLERPAGAQSGHALGEFEDFDFQPRWSKHGEPHLLAPVDLQCIKAAGVTFAISAISRLSPWRSRQPSSTWVSWCAKAW